jgi:hypothetical protein
MTAQYVNGCTGDVQIIPVTMFLVMLYNACFMYQKDKKSNMLITALDTFDLGANVDHELFMSTLSEYKIRQQIPIWKILILVLSYTASVNHLNNSVSVKNTHNKMHFRGIFTTLRTSYQQQALLKGKLIVMIEEHHRVSGLNEFLGWVQACQSFTNLWTHSKNS